MNTNPGAVRAVLRLRSLAPHGINGTQTAIIDRLRRIEADGRIAELDVDVWGGSIGIHRTADQDPAGVHETVAEFERWADDHGRTLRPALERHEQATDGGRTVLPLLCLAVYDAGTVRAVYPHVDGEDVYTIHDGVAMLESATSGGEASPGSTTEEPTFPLP